MELLSTAAVYRIFFSNFSKSSGKTSGFRLSPSFRRNDDPERMVDLKRHSGEGRARSEAFPRYPGGFKKLVFRMRDQVRHNGELWTVKLTIANSI
jgi:hypothetical protein